MFGGKDYVSESLPKRYGCATDAATIGVSPGGACIFFASGLRWGFTKPGHFSPPSPSPSPDVYKRQLLDSATKSTLACLIGEGLRLKCVRR